MENINWLALVVASLMPLVVGSLWYNPMTFLKPWQEATGVTDEEAKQGMAVTFLVSTILAFFIAFLLNYMLHGAHDHDTADFMTFKHGASHGVLLTVMAILPVVVSNSMYEKRSWKYMLINVGYWAVSLALMGGIIQVWV